MTKTSEDFNERTLALEAALWAFLEAQHLKDDTDDVYPMGDDLIHVTVNKVLSPEQLEEMKKISNETVKDHLGSETLEITIDFLDEEGSECTEPDMIPLWTSILFDMQPK